ncbi:hypothetical protein QFC21_002365 [Naganishia friedmannii]|uniref:Uncharacterized protein n=1 Tax=Naganishia friedmannii TaxID=89922 RepID=A0ACC2VYE1_9TREE|nr:hypothetical protein QFC21_002365 [Naganishia friedmannii]
MSRIFEKLAKLMPFGKNRPVGYDLQGNRFYQQPNPNGGRPKRFVEYKDSYRDLSEYTARASLPEPPTVEELQKDMQRQQRLRQDVQLIQERDDAESQNRKMLAGPTESANVTPQHGQASPTGAPSPTNMPPSIHEPSSFSTQKHGHPSITYPFASPASSSAPAEQNISSPHQNDPRSTADSDGTTYKLRNDPTAPADSNLRRLAQQQTELARKRMEIHKSPLSGFAPIDPSQSWQAGRVSSDAVKGDETRGDTDAETGYAAASSVTPRPRRRTGGTTTASEEGAKHKGLSPAAEQKLFREGRVDATTKSEIQDVQAGTEEDVQRKLKELGSR